MPRVSVTMPAYNAERSIARAVRSVLESTLTDLECVVVDDGSKDNALAELDSIKDKRLRVIAVDHAGVAAAANRAVQESRAPIIARMDADDYCHPTRLEKQLTQLDAGGVDGIGGRVRIVNQQGGSVPSMKRYEAWVNDHLTDDAIRACRFVESPLVNPTMTAKREVFELGFRNGPFPEDYDLWLRAMQAGFRFGKVSDVVLDWTDGPGRLTRSHANYSADAFDRCRREHLLLGPMSGVTRVRFWGAGQTGKPWLRWLREQAIAVDCAVDVSPRKLGEVIHGARVVSPDDLPAADGTPLLIGVGAPGARELILLKLSEAGYRPGRDAWFVA